MQWRQADATKLPFADGAFDAVVCQFGLMFFPDKAAGIREAFRVLRSGGQYLFNVWDAIEHTPITRITHETVAEFFPTDPPQFYRVPFSLHEPEPIVRMLGKRPASKRSSGADSTRRARARRPPRPLPG